MDHCSYLSVINTSLVLSAVPRAKWNHLLSLIRLFYFCLVSEMTHQAIVQSVCRDMTCK